MRRRVTMSCTTVFVVSGDAYSETVYTWRESVPILPERDDDKERGR